MRFFIILLIFFTSNSYAQITITGKITDHINKSLPGINVYIKDTYIGTISNKQGRFQIGIPENHRCNKLTISGIGYQTEELRIDTITSPLIIQLQKDTVHIKEVMVMPKDTLLSLLCKAHGKIKDNYPDDDFRMKGLYRETYFTHKNMEYLYFGEALLDIFKTSYKYTSAGQVKIVKSRMNKHPLYDQYSSVLWYGGLLFPLYTDDVKRRALYLTPDGFKKYNYTIYKDKLDNQSVYRIEFKPKENQKVRYEGKFYLDINSLAYLYIECTFSKYGFYKRNRYLALHKLEAEQRKEKLKYKLWNGKYYLSYSSTTESLYNHKTQLRVTHYGEYITTNIKLNNINPIPFTEQVDIRDVFYLKAKDYYDSEWKNHSIMLPDSSINKLMGYSSKEANQILNKKYTSAKDLKFKQKMIHFLTRMYVDIAFETRMISEIRNGNILYASKSYQNFHKELDFEVKRMYSYGIKMGYKLNRKWDVNYYSASSLNKHLFDRESIGFSYKTPIKNRGNQLFLLCGADYFFDSNGLHIGNFQSNAKFHAGGKKISADKIALYIGKKKQGISFDVGMKTRLYHFYSLFVMAGYQLNFLERDRLFIREKSGFILTRKKTDISLKDPSIQYFENEIKSTETNFETDNFYLKAGIRFAF